MIMQFLLRESNCEALNKKCIAYATSQKALCFYEEPPSKYFWNCYGLSIASSALEQKTLFNIAIPEILILF